MEANFCVACGARTSRKSSKSTRILQYAGICCSSCFRMSHVAYLELVERIGRQRHDFLVEQLKGCGLTDLPEQED
jgi:hypothetical protein